MKKLDLVKCISSMHDFNKEELLDTNVGVEFQDFTNVNTFFENWSKVFEYYYRELEDFRGIKSMHGPFIDLKPYSYDTYIRDASVNKYKMAMNIAALLDLDYIVFHSQINPHISNTQLIEIDNNLHSDFLNRLLDEFDNYSGLLLIENVYEWDAYSLKNLIDTIGNDRIKIAFDVGHAMISNIHSVEDWIKILGEDIGYCHFHSNNKRVDQHCRPDETVLSEILKLFYKYDIKVPLSLEYFPEDMRIEKSYFKTIIEKENLEFEIP